MEARNIREAMMYYLFIMESGKTKNKEVMFKDICKQLGLNDASILDVVKTCEEMAKKYLNDPSNILLTHNLIKGPDNDLTLDNFIKAGDISVYYSEKLLNKTLDEIDSEERFEHTSKEDEEMLALEQTLKKSIISGAKLMWNFICLGYADGNFSKKEEQIIQTFMQQYGHTDYMLAALVKLRNEIGELLKEKDNLSDKYQQSLVSSFENEINEKITKKIESLDFVIEKAIYDDFWSELRDYREGK